MTYQEKMPDGTTRLTGAAGGAVGPEGPVGTRWGSTPIWVIGTYANAPVEFPDGDPPREGDLVISSNGFSIGYVSIVTAVVDATHADLAETHEGASYPPLRGPTGATGPTGPAGTALDAWPVNSVYISLVNTNPGTIFGGTWSAIATGRVLIGVDSGDAAMDAAQDTGGSKTTTLTEANLPPHAHTIQGRESATSGGAQNRAATGAGTAATRDWDSGQGAGTATAFSNLPPYFAVYMWKRTA